MTLRARKGLSIGGASDKGFKNCFRLISMKTQSLKLTISDQLRKARALALGLRNGTQMKLRGIRTRQSDMPLVIVLSLGNLGRSAEVARQAAAQGFKVHVFCKDYPTPEAQFAHGWTRLDCRTNFDHAVRVAKTLNPVGILLESKNLLLPMQNHLAEALGLKAVGEWAAKTSNSKIALRESLDRSGLPNLPWVRAEDFATNPIDFPMVIKPDLGTASKGVRYLVDKAALDADNDFEDDVQSDESVGEQMLLESYVAGRQFDLEGVASHGNFHVLTIVEEFYEASPPYFPPTWFHFNPPIDDATRDNMTRTTFKALKAMGVENGGWHMEQRVDKDGIVRVLDYANRMGYNMLVSAAAGVSFCGEYVKAMSHDNYPGPNLRPQSLLQIFAFGEAKIAKMRKLVAERPDDIHSSSFFPFKFSYHLYLGYVVVQAKDYPALYKIIDAYDLVPDEFEAYYGDAHLG